MNLRPYPVGEGECRAVVSPLTRSREGWLSVTIFSVADLGLGLFSTSFSSGRVIKSALNGSSAFSSARTSSMNSLFPLHTLSLK
jgi:hypothetical protein